MPSVDHADGREWHVSVNVCTYNRHTLLRQALESLLAQQVDDDTRFEIIVVDNNSTDATRQVVDEFIQRGHSHIRYVFERRQGLSYARNAAVAAARAPIVAFTDDDVRVEPAWVQTIKRALDRHPEVDCVGGKIVPLWPTPPPMWLTKQHWGPLAIVDYGNVPFYVSARNRLCLLTANMAIRKDVLEGIGRFRPQLQRVRNRIGSMEDHELLIRLWNVQRQGMYIPELVAASEVAADRLSKEYHRRWHFGHGYFYAVARLEDMERSRIGSFIGVPAHLYKRAALDAARWLGNMVRGNLDRAFDYEVALQFFAGFLRRRYKDVLTVRPAVDVEEAPQDRRSYG
jgi:glycosyltransferase involved in cell wall biosynthesis